jgi:hypothetical protein
VRRLLQQQQQLRKLRKVTAHRARRAPLQNLSSTAVKASLRFKPNTTLLQVCLHIFLFTVRALGQMMLLIIGYRASKVAVYTVALSWLTESGINEAHEKGHATLCWPMSIRSY